MCSNVNRDSTFDIYFAILENEHDVNGADNCLRREALSTIGFVVYSSLLFPSSYSQIKKQMSYIKS